MGDELRGENLVHLNVRFSTETELKKIQDFLYEKSGQGVSFTGLVEAVANEVTIVTAVHNIKSNKGSRTAGVDKMKMDKYLQMPKDELILLIQSSFRNYRPKPARREYIEKSNGKKRPLGIPTVLDRIIQECVRIIIEPICEARFYPQSYGFRPYRAQKHAIRGIINVINAGCKSPDQPVWAIEGDIKGCFDNINHRLLLQKLWKIGIPNVEKMSAEFTELIANPPKVSYRDGHYFVFDGQHTIVTRRAMNGGQDLPIICKVYEGLTEEEEAMLFSRQTGVSTPLTAGAELRAALVGKDPESLAFVKATESTGLQLGLDSYRAPWKIICIRTAFKEYKAYGADLYKEALTMLAKGWEGDPDSLRSGILQGMVRFVALYQGEYDPDRLVKRLHTVHPMTLVNDEKSLSGTVSYKYMMLILRTYNGASRRFNLPIKQ